MALREEQDQIGKLGIDSSSYHGIHTQRAIRNFPLMMRPVHPELVKAFGEVKLAAARTNARLGLWDDDPGKFTAMEKACLEMAQGKLTEMVVVDALQGGAGTSTNMNVNEVLANRALEIIGEQLGFYDKVSPLEDINRHQSTNDTFATALKIAAINGLRYLEAKLVALQEAFQKKEKEFATVVKIGRTQLMDAVLTTLGKEMGAYAEAVNRDRWRVYKCEERLRVINLGGTAIGTGLGAPRQYIFSVVEQLRSQTGIGLARAENLVEATQNADVFAEVSGILKTTAVNLLKISGDLRILSSGPDAGFGEIELPARQSGSSIMPEKTNPVIPEAVSQAAMLVMGHDQVIGHACSMGNLELNPFLPLVAHCLLESLDLLARSADILAQNCINGIVVNEKRCSEHVNGACATATALISAVGHEAAANLARESRITGRSVKELVVDSGMMSLKQLEELLMPESICKLGS